MECINKFFLMAAGLVVTAALIFLGFRLAEAGEQSGNEMVNQFVAFNAELKDREILQYDGATVNGSDVINIVRKYMSGYLPGSVAPFHIVVETNVVTVYEDNSGLKDMMNFSHASYINPTGKFTGEVLRNENGVITSVSFKQK